MVNIKKTNNNSKKKMSGGDDKSVNDVLFLNNKISTQPNIDPEYKEEGIFHITKTDAVSALRQDVTNFFNTFGAKGIDNPIFDNLRSKLLTKIEDKIPIIESNLKADIKICNLRMDINIDQLLIIMTAYGTLVSKQKILNKTM
jgi:hypothetical protein